MGNIAEYITDEADTQPMRSPTRAAIAVCCAGVVLTLLGGLFLAGTFAIFTAIQPEAGPHRLWGEVFMILVLVVALSFLIASGLFLRQGVGRLMALTYP